MHVSVVGPRKKKFMYLLINSQCTCQVLDFVLFGTPKSMLLIQGRVRDGFFFKFFYFLSKLMSSTKKCYRSRLPLDRLGGNGGY